MKLLFGCEGDGRRDARRHRRGRIVFVVAVNVGESFVTRRERR